jgi:hypothetical protein
VLKIYKNKKFVMGSAVKAKKTPLVESSIDASIENTNTAVESKIPGRPVDQNSARQQRLVAAEMKKLLGGGELKRGRPVNAESDRQKKLANKNPDAKPGRPKMSAEEKARNDEARKAHQKAEAERIATVAKEKLYNAGMLNEDGTAKEGVTKEMISGVLSSITEAAVA